MHYNCMFCRTFVGAVILRLSLFDSRKRFVVRHLRLTFIKARPRNCQRRLAARSLIYAKKSANNTPADSIFHSFSENLQIFLNTLLSLTLKDFLKLIYRNGTRIGRLFKGFGIDNLISLFFSVNLDKSFTNTLIIIGNESCLPF